MQQTFEFKNTEAKSSKCSRYSLIPKHALQRLARRYEDGLAIYDKDNWRKGVNDKEYVIHRLEHVIDHALTLIEKLEGRIPWTDDDDAAAIMWGGAFACEATKEFFGDN